MSRILITSGPTRQYLDPVRYLSNGSSGLMGKALAEAVLAAGHEAVIVSGPVEVRYPSAARVVPVVSTEEMLAACLDVFPQCAGLIAAAAPCDYRPRVVAAEKIRKSVCADRSTPGGNARHRGPAGGRQDHTVAGRLRPGDVRPSHEGDAEAGAKKMRHDRC